jgi:hypothetical protein
MYSIVATRLLTPCKWNFSDRPESGRITVGRQLAAGAFADLSDRICLLDRQRVKLQWLQYTYTRKIKRKDKKRIEEYSCCWNTNNDPATKYQFHALYRNIARLGSGGRNSKRILLQDSSRSHPQLTFGTKVCRTTVYGLYYTKCLVRYTRCCFGWSSVLQNIFDNS